MILTGVLCSRGEPHLNSLSRAFDRIWPCGVWEPEVMAGFDARLVYATDATATETDVVTVYRVVGTGVSILSSRDTEEVTLLV